MDYNDFSWVRDRLKVFPIMWDQAENYRHNGFVMAFAINLPMANVKAPAYLDVDKDKAAIKLLEVPMRDKVPVICEIGMVVEFYSR